LSVVIIERRSFFRDLMVRALSSPTVFPTAVGSAEEWRARSKSARADLILLSVASSRRDDELRRELASLTKLTDSAPIVILSDDQDVDHVVRALDLGASGYISTDMSLAVAIEAIRLVRAGGIYAPTDSLIASARRSDGRGGRRVQVKGGAFTPRQFAVIEALRRGKSNKIIAYELNMCESTVKVHVRNIMKRLQAKNRTEVAYMTNEIPELERG
jgi:DNA-binding NarL/FixJ family response regulator